MDKLPDLPDDDSDFTPELARKIIAKYQELLSLLREPTEAMALAGARSIGNTIHTDNHLERARECWRAMWAARDWIMEPVPRVRRP